MPVNEWLGDAQGVFQVDTLTVGGAPAAGNKIRATINRKYVEYTFVTADTTALMAAGLQALLSASDIPEFKEVTWTYPGTGAVITGTSADPGRPFTVTASATGGGATLTQATVTNPTGPNHADNALNWSLSAVPADTDSILIRTGAAILYGFAAFTKDFANFEIAASYTGTIGLPLFNGQYVEYRARYAVLGNTVGFPVQIHTGQGDGSGQLFLSLKGGDVVSVFGSGSRSDSAVPSASFIIRSGTTTVLNCQGSADVGLGVDVRQTQTIATLRVIDDATVRCGSGTTLTTVDQDGGSLTQYGVTTTLNKTAGSYVQADGTLVTIVNDGGPVVLNHTGTVTTATFRGQGFSSEVAWCDCRSDPRALVFTNSTFVGGAYIKDPNFRVTFTNPSTMDRASLVNSDLGARFLVLRS